MKKENIINFSYLLRARVLATIILFFAFTDVFAQTNNLNGIAEVKLVQTNKGKTYIDNLKKLPDTNKICLFGFDQKKLMDNENSNFIFIRSYNYSHSRGNINHAIYATFYADKECRNKIDAPIYQYKNYHLFVNVFGPDVYVVLKYSQNDILEIVKYAKKQWGLDKGALWLKVELGNDAKVDHRFGDSYGNVKVLKIPYKNVTNSINPWMPTKADIVSSGKVTPNNQSSTANVKPNNQSSTANVKPNNQSSTANVKPNNQSSTANSAKRNNACAHTHTKILRFHSLDGNETDGCGNPVLIKIYAQSIVCNDCKKTLSQLPDYWQRTTLFHEHEFKYNRRVKIDDETVYVPSTETKDDGHPYTAHNYELWKTYYKCTSPCCALETSRLEYQKTEKEQFHSHSFLYYHVVDPNTIKKFFDIKSKEKPYPQKLRYGVEAAIPLDIELTKTTHNGVTYYIMDKPVMGKLYNIVMKNKSKKSFDENSPVNGLSYDDACNFISTLNDKIDHMFKNGDIGQSLYFRLPTPDQWFHSVTDSVKWSSFYSREFTDSMYVKDAHGRILSPEEVNRISSNDAVSMEEYCAAVKLSTGNRQDLKMIPSSDSDQENSCCFRLIALPQPEIYKLKIPMVSYETIMHRICVECGIEQTYPETRAKNKYRGHDIPPSIGVFSEASLKHLYKYVKENMDKTQRLQNRQEEELRKVHNRFSINAVEIFPKQ